MPNLPKISMRRPSFKHAIKVKRFCPFVMSCKDGCVSVDSNYFTTVPLAKRKANASQSEMSKVVARILSVQEQIKRWHEAVLTDFTLHCNSIYQKFSAMRSALNSAEIQAQASLKAELDLATKRFKVDMEACDVLLEQCAAMQVGNLSFPIVFTSLDERCALKAPSVMENVMLALIPRCWEPQAGSVVNSLKRCALALQNMSITIATNMEECDVEIRRLKRLEYMCMPKESLETLDVPEDDDDYDQTFGQLSIAVNKDGSKLAVCCCKDDERWAVGLLELPSFRHIGAFTAFLGDESDSGSLCFADNDNIIITKNYQLELIEFTPSGALVRIIDCPFFNVRIRDVDANSNVIAVCSRGRVEIHDYETGEILNKFFKLFGRRIRITPDGRFVITDHCEESRLAVYTLNGSLVKTFSCCPKPGMQMQFSFILDTEDCVVLTAESLSVFGIKDEERICAWDVGNVTDITTIIVSNGMLYTLDCFQTVKIYQIQPRVCL